MAETEIQTLLVLGGARSGKSRYALMQAEAAAAASGRELVFVATAEACDDEMRSRIARHQQERHAGWRTVEAPLELVSVVDAERDGVVLVDCLTLWLSNLMFAGRPVDEACAELAAAIADRSAPLILVTNEVGLGIVPDNEVSRQFRDLQGHLNQALAQVCRRVVFVAAGLPLRLKA